MIKVKTKNKGDRNKINKARKRKCQFEEPDLLEGNRMKIKTVIMNTILKMKTKAIIIDKEINKKLNSNNSNYKLRQVFMKNLSSNNRLRRTLTNLYHQADGFKK